MSDEAAQPQGAEDLFLDPLTALPNRRWIVGTLPAYFDKLRAADSSLAIVLLDIDGFAAINESAGRGQGDILLQAVAGRISASCGSDAVAARYAGDEFLVLLPDTEEFFARIAAEELVATVSSEVLIPEEAGGGQVSLSAGVASCPHDGLTVAELFSSAKEALYLAKRRGRGAVATAEDVSEASVSELDPFALFPCQRLVGRSKQMAAVGSAASAAAPGEGRLAIVSGPSGVGKTRFLGEVTQSLAGKSVTALQAACSGGWELWPFSLAKDLVESHIRAGSRTPEGVMRILHPQQAAELARIVPILGAMVPGAADAPLPDDATVRHKIAFSAMLRLFEGLSHERSLALIIDDVQWADAASLELISALARSPQVALLVLASESGSRDPFGDKAPVDLWLAATQLSRGALAVTLEPFTPPETAEMLDALIPGRHHDAEADARTAEITSGVPLAIQELVKDWVSRGAGDDLRSELGRYPPETSRAPMAVLDRRFASLGDVEREVAAVCGTAGGWAELDAIVALTGKREGEVLEAIEHLMRQGMMRPTGAAGQVAFGFYSPVMASRAKRLASVEVVVDVQKRLKLLAAGMGASEPSAHIAYRLAVSGLMEEAVRLRASLLGLARTAAEADVAGIADDRRPPERPRPSTAVLSEWAQSMMKPLMDAFVGAVREARDASASATAALTVVSRLIELFEAVLDHVGVLTLSARQNAMRANGVLLGVRPYGDSPALVGGIMRRKGIEVVTIDSSVKIDELVRLVHVLSQDVPPVSRADEYESFLDSEGIYHIAIEPARAMPKVTSVPHLPGPAEAEPQAAEPEAPPAPPLDPFAADERSEDDAIVEALTAATMSFESPDPVDEPVLASPPPPALIDIDEEEEAPPPVRPKTARRGGRRRAIFETHVDLLPAGMGAIPKMPAADIGGAPRIAGDRPAVLDDIPAGDDPLKLTSELEQILPGTIRALVNANEMEWAGKVVTRLLMGFPDEDLGRRRISNFLLRGIELFVKIPDDGLAKALERVLAKELAVEENAGTAELLAESARECVVHFVEVGRFHAAGHIVRALAGARSPAARSVLAGLARTDIFDSLLSDIRSGDPTRIQNSAVVLASMGEWAQQPIIEVIKETDDHRVRSAAAFVLSESCDEPPPELRASLGPAAPPEERVRVLGVADRLGFDVAQAAFEAMIDSDERVIAAGLKLSGRLPQVAQLALLHRLADSGTAEGIRSAFEAAGALGLAGAMDILAEHLPESSDPTVMEAGARALGKLAGAAGVAQPKSVRLLQAVLAKSIAIATPQMKAVAMQVVRSLGAHDAPEAAEVLEAATGYPDAEVADAARRICESRK